MTVEDRSENYLLGVVNTLLHEVCDAAIYIQHYHRSELREYARDKAFGMVCNAEQAVEDMDVGDVLEKTRALMEKATPARPSKSVESNVTVPLFAELQAENARLHERWEELRSWLHLASNLQSSADLPSDYTRAVIKRMDELDSEEGTTVANRTDAT